MAAGVVTGSTCLIATAYLSRCVRQMDLDHTELNTMQPGLPNRSP